MTREQFIKLVEGSQEKFRSFLVALCCGDTALADDIAQESYVKAYLTSGSLKDPAKFNAWIYRIGYNTFIDNKRASRCFEDFSKATKMLSNVQSDSSFNYQGLYLALNKLTPKERTSVLLFYIEGYSIQEISQLEKTTVAAVKKHLSRGREHLRGLLSAEQDYKNLT